MSGMFWSGVARTCGAVFGKGRQGMGMKISEKDVQGAIVMALLFDKWLVLRINQGGMYGETTCPVCHGVRGRACTQCNGAGIIASRYVRYAWWQALGMDPQDSGISDVIAMKLSTKKGNYTTGTIPMVFRLLAIEVKAPGKKTNVSHAQAHFLAAIEKHGGIAIVADDLSDVAPYLDRVEVD